MRIRLLQKKDIKDAAAIVGKNYSKKWEKTSTAEIASMFSKDAAIRPKYYVAEEKGAIIGFAGYTQSWMDYNVYQIFWVNVLPEWQGKGIGKKLVAMVIDDIKRHKGARLIQLTATPSNARYYKKHFDFKILEKLHGTSLYYLMSLALPKR